NIPGANGKTYTIDSVRPSHSGYYRLLVSEPWNAGDPDCALFSNLIYLQVNPLPIVNLGPDTAICQGESLTLNAGNSGASYLWNTGATTQQITVNTTGTYWVNVTNSYGCSAADTMQLTVNPLPIVNLGPDTAICQGESLMLDAGNSGATYLWSTGATTQQININTAGTYWVRVTNGFGCSAADTLQLTVNPLPIVNLGPDTAICQGESLMLNAGNSGATYLWSTGATTQTLAVNATGTYWVKVTNGFGCSAADTLQLTVNPLPTVNLGPDTAICQGESLMLDAGNSGASYLWSTGATTQTLAVNTTGTYWVRVTNGFGCSASDTLQLTVNSLPIVNLGPDTAICQGESLTLNAGNSGATYLWSTGATTQTLAVNATGTYWVKVTNSYGCSAADTMQLTVNPLPIVNLGPDTAICQGESLMLNAGNSGASYLWNTGATTQTLAVNTTGTYWVRVTNGFGCSASDTLQLTVNPLPTVNLGPDTAICQGESLMLNAGNSGATYLWNTGQTSQSIQIDNAGTYWVKVTNGFGCSASDTLQLTVNPLPIVNLGPDTAICQGESLMLDAGNSGATYLWNTGATTQTLAVNTTGAYWVRVTNGFGCSATDTLQLTVNPLPIVNLGPDTAICQGESLTLNAGNSGASYLWNTGATTQQININTAGTYWVKVTNGFGCSAADTLQLTVNPLPIVNLGPDTAICQGESLMLNAGNSGATYLWSTGATTQTLAVNTTGTYWVRVTNGFGCSAADTMQLTVNPLPIVNLGPDTAICQGESLTLNAGNSGATYLWSTGATTQTLAVNTTGTYWVRVTNGFGCSAADTMQLTVNPLPIVNLGPDTAICQGESLTLDAGNSGASYHWSTGATTQQININTAGTYWVKVTNGFGCSAADTTRLQIHPLPVIQVSGDTAVCQGTWITLWVQETLRSRENNTQPSSLLWSTDVQDDSIRVQVNQDIAYWIRVTNTWGCSQSDTIHLKALPLPNLRLAHDTSACQGQPITLDAGGDGIQYRWSTGDTSRQITLKPSGADDDNVYRVEVINRFGCSAKDSVRLRVHPLPQLSLARQVNMCEGQRITLHASSLTGENYTYQWNDQSRADSLNVSRPGTYWVISSNGFCLRIDTVEVSLLSNTLPRLNPEAVLCPNSSLVLDVSSPDAIAYMWSTGATTPAITIDTPGTYTVLINGAVCNYTRLDTVRVKQGFLPGVHILADDSLICSGDRLLLCAIGDHTEGYRWQDGTYGPSYTATTAGLYRVQAFNVCGIATDSIMLQPAADCVGDIIMPNAFTPNNDGHNDVFRPKVLHQVFDFELRIFNRWGQLLFVTHDWTQGWDGTFHGQPCDAGGYAWWVKYRETPGGPVMFKKGVLTLLR
ncbi:MAG: gliding motility-associated C-terminal domain-containing protein, partial [Thermoflavifilum sp.]|uniref:T9SS type B sorting domain-containing protein n=1 Tax=Thermoflavifilum sp. TaxID=1968839 RepID=UPI0018A5AF2B